VALTNIKLTLVMTIDRKETGAFARTVTPPHQ